MSDTPLTDKLCVYLPPNGLEALVETLKFARDLERQLAEAKAQLDTLQRINQDNVNRAHWYANRADQLESQLAERDAMLAECTSLLSKIDALEESLRIADADDQPHKEHELFKELTETWEKIAALTESLPATAKANAKIMAAVDYHYEIQAALGGLCVCSICQAVREKRGLKP